jgi:hypothetical protein
VNITPTDTRIRALFQSSFYKIPRFQRPYSWDKENIEDFWNDAVVSGKQGYFIGSMVLYGGKTGQDLFVVDGQQRLTTITIFLAALRDSFIEVGESALAHGIQGVIQRPDMNAQSRYVLLTESSYPYFQEYVQKLGAPELKIEPSDEEQGIQSAYQFARLEFGKIVAEVSKRNISAPKKKLLIKKRLEDIRDCLLSLDVIVIQLDNEDDAYIVFETLNTRGKDLEPKDLIKNLLTRFLPAKSADVDSTKIKWDSLIQSLAQSAANIDASSYLHHYWLSRYDYTPERTLFEKVKSKVTKINALEFLNGLTTDVESYRRIFEPDNFFWAKEEESLKRSLLALAMFKVRQPTPLILAVLRAYYAKAISLKQAKDAVSAIERFHFMHTAVAGQSSSGGVSMMYAAAARDLSSEDDVQKRAKQIQDFITKLKGRVPDRETFNAGFSELRYSQADARARPLVRYILEKIDAIDRKGLPVNYVKMTIEHISSQNPPPGTDKDEKHASIGNLILVSEELNQKLKNNPFPKKKTLMIADGMPLDEVIKNANSWDDSQITARTKAMSDLVYGS